MADWKDFYEDNRESWGQYLDSLDAKRKTRATNRTPPSPPIAFCPLCHGAFIEDGLPQHIRSVHGPQHIYLRVNGQIIRDIGWAERGISELTLVQLGFADATVELTAHNLDKKLHAHGNENLGRYIPRAFEGELTIRVTPNGVPHRLFTLYARSLPEFRRDDLDSLIQRRTQQSLRAGPTPDITDWRDEVGNLGPLERRYLDGFFEYTLAFHLEQKAEPKLARQHFEDAFGLLLPYRTPFAHSAQCVLGLRMNCFGVLARAPKDSIISAANRFFNDSFPSHWKPVGDDDAETPFITYADDFTIRLIQVTACFYGQNHAAFQAGLEALTFHPSAKDKNNEDKLALLAARFSRQNGRVSEARRSYEILHYHPLFGTEAEDFLHGKSRK